MNCPHCGAEKITGPMWVPTFVCGTNLEVFGEPDSRTFSCYERQIASLKTVLAASKKKLEQLEEDYGSERAQHLESGVREQVLSEQLAEAKRLLDAETENHTRAVEANAELETKIYKLRAELYLEQQ